ncbi:hypothetical protein M5689_022899 [Euphorbia peplus]|nr:hypothetical protein M5689_022899 [Euphorbia peplus]
MAYSSPTPSKHPWRITSPKINPSIHEISTSSLFFSKNSYKKSFSLITCSIEPSSSSSSHTNVIKNLRDDKEPLKIAETFYGFFSIVYSKEVKLEKSSKKKEFWLFKSKKIRSIFLLNFITIIYASNIPIVKVIEEMMEPAEFSAMRFVMCAIPFLPFVYRARGDVETRNAGVELGLWVSLGYILEALALLTSDAGRASFISIFTVIIVPLLEGMLGATIPTHAWIGVAMSAIGVAMLECSGSPPNVGDLLNFLSAIFFGIHTLRTGHFSRTTKKDSLLPLLGYQVTVVALLSMAWVALAGCSVGIQESEQSLWTLPMIWDWIVAFPWIPALYTGSFSTGLCLWAEFAAMRDVSATETAIIYGLEPLWGAGFAWFLLGERWGMAGWFGAALVLGGSLVVQIFGASVPNESMKGEKEIKKYKSDVLNLEEQKLRNRFSASPVVVRSRKDFY